MALINRVARLFKADFNAVLDQIEEPEQVLKQAIRDMEDDLAATGKQVAGYVREQKHLQSRAGDLEAEAGKAESELDLCIASGKDDLARTLVRRKLECGRMLQHLARRIGDLDALIADANQRLRENGTTLESLKQKAELFASSPGRRNGEFDENALCHRNVQVSDDEVEIAFLHEKEARQPS